MSVSWGTQYAKLKTNLRLAINRLKLVEKKKTELAQKSRKEIADFISAHKEDRARIRVEHIVREDYLVEAYELLEMYCDLLLARFGLIQQMKGLDEGIEEAISSIMWAAPRVATDIAEFKIISDQLTMKYGKPFAEACRQNQLGKVAPKLMAKLNVQAPPKILVERYMIEIAKSHGIPFDPDPNVMREDEVAAAEAMLIDFQNQGQQGYGWMYPPGAPGAPPSGPPMGPAAGSGNNNYPGPPPLPPPPNDNNPNQGFYPSGGGGGGGSTAAALKPFNYPNLKEANNEPGPITKVPENPLPGIPTAPQQQQQVWEEKTPQPQFQMPALPEPPTGFPDVPSDENWANPGSGPPGSGPQGSGGPEPPGDDLDFDDLSKRFEQLKKRQR